MIRRDVIEAATSLELRFKETMKILAGVEDMKQPDPHELINLKGAGKAETVLKESGNWDEYAGLEYKYYEVVADVVIKTDDFCTTIVKARSKEEAEELAINEMEDDGDIIEVYDITKVEEIT